MLSDKDLEHFESFVDSDGLVSKANFILYMKKSNQFANVNPNTEVNMMEKAWKLFDKNGDGKLTPDEFRWMTDKEVLTDGQIQTMFRQCDEDGDGHLDFEEFRKMILKHRLSILIIKNVLHLNVLLCFIIYILHSKYECIV